MSIIQQIPAQIEYTPWSQYSEYFGHPGSETKLLFNKSKIELHFKLPPKFMHSFVPMVIILHSLSTWSGLEMETWLSKENIFFEHCYDDPTRAAEGFPQTLENY